MLLELSDRLPPLPPAYQAQKDAGEHRVHECQTPVYLWIELVDGRVRIIGDVAPEAPTVKGFVSLLIEALDGGEPDEVLAVPQNLIHRIGLAEALGMQRMHGLNGVLGRIRREVAKLAAAT